MATPTLRLQTAGDADAIDGLLRAAFGGEDEVVLVRALRAAGDLTCALVAEEAGAVVGFVGFSPLRVAPDPGYPVWALAPLAVAPSAQRRGFGAALVAAGLERAEAAGVGLVTVLGDPGYYGRFGFRAELAAGLAAPWTGPAFQGLCFGGAAPPEGKADYAEAFDALL